MEVKEAKAERPKKPKRELKEYRKGNKRQAITPAQAQEIIVMVAEGQTLIEIAKRMDKDPAALGAYLIKYGYSPQQTKKHGRVIRLW